MPRTVGIGLDDFAEMVQNHCFYVDKTLFIKEWWESHDKVTLITRPRRFGKTLAMNMLHQFFSVKYAGRKDLFEGLSIWKEEAYRTLQGTYPVIFFSFSEIKGSNYSNTRRGICQILADLFAEHAFLYNSGVLTEQEKDFFRKVTDNMGDMDAARAVKRLSSWLMRFYGKKVIILLDEYDTPMQEAYLKGYWKELAEFTRSLFNATFKSNPYMERGIMTGITRVSKESVFSDLNNLKVVTTTTAKYETAFGFTEEEVFAALEEFQLQDQKEEVRKWYDGFQFGNCSHIYNPWSIINFLDEKEFHSYWVNTSSNGLVEKLIREGSSDIKLVMEDLLKGNDFHMAIDEEIIYDQLDCSSSAVWSMFLASGYLKVKNYTIDTEWGQKEYDLSLTNQEVRIMFQQMIARWFWDNGHNYNYFVKALLLGEIEAMNEYMNRVALATFSMFDTGTKPSDCTEPERFYHGFVLGLLVELRNRYTVSSNRESGFGRYDVMLKPRKEDDDGIILEFKVHHPKTEKTLEDTVRSALQQIVDKKYAAMLEAEGILHDKTRIYGFAFEGQKVLIDGGLIGIFE